MQAINRFSANSLQVSSLVTLGLLACLTNSERLNSPKYKSLVSLDFIKPISR